ncbi:hypothetical protein K469DRAFT_710179 [Zopfia rhizophila CBS 207.26]|uniref:Uncharacterized protein n=1 Tax=Zopfia rhizophila CBS 207.26 TaxID=1314779 RepID=A0A6A6DVW2_9PEZI|nr:hypothetical protein K469DRAFT_710179 [Zopfia rhizophila CBS 207.26]
MQSAQDPHIPYLIPRPKLFYNKSRPKIPVNRPSTCLPSLTLYPPPHQRPHSDGSPGSPPQP